MSTAHTVEEIGHVIGLRRDGRRRRWLEVIVNRRMKRALAKANAKRHAGAYADVPPETRARSVVRWACTKVAFTGLLSGAASTGALLATVETEGLAGIVALPFGALAIGSEMVARAVIHVDLACELAEIFGVKLDTANDVARLMSLVARNHVRHEGEEEDDDMGQSQMERVTVDRDALLERGARMFLGESVLRNVVPFVGIVSSALTNVIVTRRLGRTIRRSFRYERAVLDALRDAADPCGPCMDLLVEGLWFTFIADGRLTMEETACLAQRLDDMDPERRKLLLARFVSDETDWMRRLQDVPEGSRDTFLHVLEVAAALDKSLALPQQRILRRVADAFQRRFDPQRIHRLVDQFEETGVL
jgi:hypothetical protein